MRERVTVPTVREMKLRGEKIAMLTAYDFSTARLLERAGVDVLLVGDSLGMVTLGYDSTVPVTLEEMIHHTKAVVRGAGSSLVVSDLPFGSYGESAAQAVRSATRLMKEGGCAAVKLEGGTEVVPAVEAIVRTGIPVVGHVGLTPQSAGKFGGFKVQGKTAKEAAELLQSARDIERAGAFMVVVEAVPEAVGERISAALEVPVIGIGAGAGCDGQVLVSPDMLGLQDELTPRYLKRYADLATTVVQATSRYILEVKEGTFPAEEHGYGMQTEERQSFLEGD